MRDAFLSSIVCFAALAFLGCGEPGPANVILISIDTLRPDHLSCYGYPKETSPNIDRLAGEGALFETVLADSSWTLPSHVSMMTGLTSGVHQVQYDAFRLDPKRTTLAEVLQEAGYATAGFYGAPYLHPMFGFDQGFDRYESVVDHPAYDDTSFSLVMTPEQQANLGKQDVQSHRRITTPDIVDRAVAYVEEKRDDRFFLFLHLFDVHSDYIPPEEDWRLFDPNYEGSFTGKSFWRNTAFRPGMDQRDYEHVLALYDGEIHFVDRHLQRLFARLEELGLDEDTLIVITSDHGEELLEHGGKVHRYTLFDEVLKVPLVFRWKGRIDAGQRYRAQVRQIEIMPTILKLLGHDVPRDVMGIDLSPALLQGQEPEDQPAVSRLIWPGSYEGVSMRTGSAKYLRFTDELGILSQHLPAPPAAATTDPEVLRARTELERWEQREQEIRAEHGPAAEIPIEIPPGMTVCRWTPEPAESVQREYFFDLEQDPGEQSPVSDGSK